MDETTSYKIENGLAILAVENAKGSLKCVVPEEMLHIVNEMLNEANKPSFEEWFNKNQNFGALFRVIFYAHVLTAVGMSHNLPDGITSSMIKMTFLLKADIKYLGISQESFQMFCFNLPSAIFIEHTNSQNQNIPVLTVDDIENNWNEVEKLFYLSYHI